MKSLAVLLGIAVLAMPLGAMPVLANGLLVAQKQDAAYKDLIQVNKKQIQALGANSLETSSSEAQFYFDRGNTRRNSGDQQGAITDYTKAIELQPNYADAYLNRGMVYKSLGDNIGALVNFTKAIKFKPDLMIAYALRGSVSYDLGNKKGAIADYTKAIELQPDYANAYYNRGNVFESLGKKQEAISDFQKAAELYKAQGKTSDHQNALNRIQKLRAAFTQKSLVQSG